MFPCFFKILLVNLFQGASSVCAFFCTLVSSAWTEHLRSSFLSFMVKWRVCCSVRVVYIIVSPSMVPLVWFNGFQDSFIDFFLDDQWILSGLMASLMWVHVDTIGDHSFKRLSSNGLSLSILICLPSFRSMGSVTLLRGSLESQRQCNVFGLTDALYGLFFLLDSLFRSS